MDKVTQRSEEGTESSGKKIADGAGEAGPPAGAPAGLSEAFTVDAAKVRAHVDEVVVSVKLRTF